MGQDRGLPGARVHGVRIPVARAVHLLEDVPLLLVAGGADAIVTPADADRLAAAAPEGTRRLVVAGAGHGEAHATDPAAWEDAVATHLRSAFEVARS